MAVTGHKIYIVGNIAYIDQIVDSGSAMQFEGLAKDCLPRKKYVDSTEFSFSGFNGLDETKAFPFAQLKDGNGDAWADQATFEAWATSNLGKPSAGDSALIYAAALNHETVTQTSGVLIVGHQYYIQTYNAVDDFTNVGANDNVEGDFFTATGTTPTLWLSGSVLQDVTASTTASVATNSIGAISVIEVVGSDNDFNAISDGLFDEKTIPHITQSNVDFSENSYARVIDANTILFSMGEDLGYTVSAYLTITKYQ